jgi:hypothetical protein
MYRKITIALIIAVFSLLIAYGGFAGSTAQAAPCVTDSSTVAANPELSVVCNHAGTLETRVDSAFLAANPELMVASRYAATEKRTDATFLAANPELSVARRYAAEELIGARLNADTATVEVDEGRYQFLGR